MGELPQFFSSPGSSHPLLAVTVARDSVLSVAPVFFDPHVCSPPSTADLIGREMDFDCLCGRRWRLEHYFWKDGSLVGPSWILL